MSNSRPVVRTPYYTADRPAIRGNTMPRNQQHHASTEPASSAASATPSDPHTPQPPPAPAPAPAPARELDYAFKEHVSSDNCAALCTVLAANEHNPRVASQALEALGVLLERSTTHCKLVASNSTIHLMATLLSRYGSQEPRLCKAACIVVLRLAVSRASVVEKALHISASCELVLSCMRWHPAFLPIVQLGASALNALCRMSTSLCSVLIAVDGASFALRAIARARNTFNNDIPIASLGLEILTSMARNGPNPALPRNIIAGVFKHCDMFAHARIDRRFVELVHVVVSRSPRGRDAVVRTDGCMRVLSRVVDRSRGEPSAVQLLLVVCEIVVEVSSSLLRTELTSAVMNSNIVEVVVQSLEGLGHGGRPNLGEVAAAAKGLHALRCLSKLGRDVCGSLQMNNVFDLTRAMTERMIMDRGVAIQSSLLLLSVLREVGGSYYVSNIDAVFRMVVDMQEKWVEDEEILDILREAIKQMGEVSGPQQSSSSSPGAQPSATRHSSDSQQSSLRIFIRRLPNS